MSKLIVEMEMPNRCPCELAVDNNGWFSPCFAHDGIPSREKEFDDCVANGTRPSWCPICGVLPEEHGDLIDRDVAFDYINRLICGGCNAETETDCEACIKKGIDEVLYFVKPTIAAERKDDEQIH